MKSQITVTVTIITLLLCACSEEFTGLGSVDLCVSSITFHDSDPATITGTLASGKPADFILAADGPFIQSMNVYCSSEADTTGIDAANNTVSFPLFTAVSYLLPQSSLVEFEIQHSGLYWTPNYSVADTGNSLRLYARVLLSNSTAQTWHADTIRLVDAEGIVVTTATGRITVNPGTNPVPWWDAPAGSPRAVIHYGWPVPGRWNPLLAVYCPVAGRVENWPDNVYLRDDTVWFPADSLINLDLTWQQMSRQYHCFLKADSQTDSIVHWEIGWPDRLPRGAEIEPGMSSFTLSPGESVTILYKEIY